MLEVQNLENHLTIWEKGSKQEEHLKFLNRVEQDERRSKNPLFTCQTRPNTLLKPLVFH